MRLFRRQRYITVNQKRLREAARESAVPSPLRRFPPATIRLARAHDLVEHLYGSPCTTVKILRPGDTGPWMAIYHVTIRLEDWANLSDDELKRIALKLFVEPQDLRKAVDELCRGKR